MCVSTPVYIDEFRRELISHPNTKFTHYLLEGLTDGMKTGLMFLPTLSVECKHLNPAIREPEVTSQLIQTELVKGYSGGPLPYNYRIITVYIQ